jgi:hypothetical protein
LRAVPGRATNNRGAVMAIKTRITELLGIAHPIVQGA